MSEPSISPVLSALTAAVLFVSTFRTSFLYGKVFASQYFAFFVKV